MWAFGTRPLFFVVPALYVMLSAASASAWTNATVRSVDATLHVGVGGAADVELRFGVAVHQGWLRRLEVILHDVELVKETLSASFRSVTQDTTVGPSTEYSPDVAILRNERVHLNFPKKRTPRKGTYRAVVRYQTVLKSELSSSGQSKWKWVLPGWQNGMDDVTVTIVGPQDIKPLAPLEQDSTISVEQEREGNQTVIQWHRAHLPRTIPWEIGYSRSAAFAPVQAFAPTRGILASVNNPENGGRDEKFPLFALVLAVLVIAKDFGYARFLAKRHARARPLFAIGHVGRGLISLVAIVAGAMVFHESSGWGLILLSVGALTHVHGPPRFRHEQARIASLPWIAHDKYLSPPKDHALPSWIGANQPIDITTLLGWTIAAGIAILTKMSDGPEQAAWLITLTPLLNGTRFDAPLSLRAKISLLRKTASRLAKQGFITEAKFGLQARCTAKGQLVATRIPVQTLLTKADGFLNAYITIDEQPRVGGASSTPLVHLEVRHGSVAEIALRRLPSVRKTQRDGGVTLSLPATRGHLSNLDAAIDKAQAMGDRRDKALANARPLTARAPQASLEMT